MKLEIGEALFELEYTVNSVCDLEEITGKDLANIVGTPGFSAVRSLLWCGLVENMKGITIAKAGTLMHEYLKTNTLESLVTEIGRAIDASGFLDAQGVRTAKPVEKAKPRKIPAK